MGYSYGRNPLTGRYQLSCDACGSIGSTRKRTCPARVTSTSEHGGARQTLPYCPAPAYCPGCWTTRRATAHAGCHEAAAQVQARDDAKQERLDAGELAVVYAIGASRYNDEVPDGWVKVGFAGRAGAQVEYAVRDSEYDPGARPWLSDYPDARPWSELVEAP